MLAAVRIVVDTGMHSRRWSREQAIAYAIDQSGIGDYQAIQEIERALVLPGSALAEGIGMLMFVQLRQHARARLGTHFNLQRFHAAVLEQGAVPWPVLERNVNAYVARSLNARS